jgi:hypothetical protein
MKILVIDVGRYAYKSTHHGSQNHVGILVGPKMSTKKMVVVVRKIIAGWKFNAITIGYPGSIRGDADLSAERLFFSGCNSHSKASDSVREFFASSRRFLETMTPNFPELTHSGLATCVILTNDAASEAISLARLYRSEIPATRHLPTLTRHTHPAYSVIEEFVEGF